jgi:hypothetical protein
MSDLTKTTPALKDRTKSYIWTEKFVISFLERKQPQCKSALFFGPGPPPHTGTWLRRVNFAHPLSLPGRIQPCNAFCRGLRVREWWTVCDLLCGGRSCWQRSYRQFRLLGKGQSGSGIFSWSSSVGHTIILLMISSIVGFVTLVGDV